MRLFIAVEIPPTVRDLLGRLQSELQPLLPDLRWSKPSGIHLTLRFLGEATEDRLATLLEQLPAAVPFAPFHCSPGKLGLFSSRGRPRVLFVALAGAEPLLALSSWIEQRCQEAGFAGEERPFSPHLTLGRFAEGARRSPALPALPDSLTRASIPVERFVLFRSFLGPQGARHQPLAAFPLAGEAA